MVNKLIKKRRSKKRVTIRHLDDGVDTRHRRIVMSPGTVDQLCAKYYKSSSEPISVLRKRLTISNMVMVDSPEDHPNHSTIGKSQGVNPPHRRLLPFELRPFNGDVLDVGKYYVSTRNNVFVLVVRNKKKVSSLVTAFSKMTLLNTADKVVSPDLISALSNMKPFKTEQIQVSSL